MRINADTAIVYRDKKTGEIDHTNAFRDFGGQLRCMGTLLGSPPAFEIVNGSHRHFLRMTDKKREYLFTHPIRTVRGAISRFKKEESKAAKVATKNREKSK